MGYPLFLVELLFKNDNGEVSGSLIRTLSRRPKFIPRIGESVYVLPGVSPKVQDINYSGSNFSVVHLTLEPIPSSRRKEVENAPSLKGKDKWREASKRFDPEFMQD